MIFCITEQDKMARNNDPGKKVFNFLIGIIV